MSNRLKTLRERATRPRRTVPVLLDGEVRGQIEAVEDELDRLVPTDKDDRRLASRDPHRKRRAELEADLESLRRQAEDSTLYVVLEGMQRTPYRALVNQHPPRKDEDGRPLRTDILGVNYDTVQIPLVRACMRGYQETPAAGAPVLDMDRDTLNWLLGHTIPAGENEPAVEVEPFLTDRQIEVLFMAALAVCRGDEAVPLPRTRSATPTPAAE